MKKKRTVYLLAGLMIVSLLTIIAMQAGHIYRSYNEKKELVDRGVRESLSQALIKLEKRDALVFLYNKMLNSRSAQNDSTYPADPNMSRFGYIPPQPELPIHNFSISIRSSYGGVQVYEFSNTWGNDYYPEQFLSYSTFERFFDEKFNTGGLALDEVVSELEKEYKQMRRPLENRFDKEYIRKAISEELKQRGLSLNFEFAVADANHNIRLKTDGYNESITDDAYKINLYQGAIFSAPDALYIYFPGKRKYVLEGIYAQLISTVVLSLILIITFAITLVAFFRQKKLTEIKNDFINNMTHEFKTPLATIQLAAASINNPRVRENPKTVDKFTEIINQETQRMNQHVEQVLQLALLDRESLNLKKEPVDMHELIKDAISNIELIIQQRNGDVRTDFLADIPVIKADRDTLLNVVGNLLDNANKYSVDQPDILVRTYNSGNHFVFEVEDKGIGMSKDVMKRVFDKFYRASTGNVHNIKGFGLGLNYVKEIVAAHKGNISVKGNHSKGSTFIVSLPIN
ncbi:MAG: HAMP domain-containing histidine kinase [Bacteroidales bacterium]|nr:HAMP domain-containing histidine kinase [Bacteroidales bacterium]HOY39241.1 HAMP domain-containing sensor histidine kinase [Bacteroidales bacterium]HQP04216.1 HAMP domain-containing sensor histidine kinase [Bacteroidales bacterium]